MNLSDSPSETTKITSCVCRVSTVLRSRRFQVPWHQRTYDWGTQEVEDLLQDLRDALARQKTCYFLGSIMLIKSHRRGVWRINDGQQRLITFSLLTAALCRRFASSGRQAHEQIAIGALFATPDDVTVVGLDEAHRYDPRIEPPAHDKENYRRLLLGESVPAGGLLASAWKAVDRFAESMDPRTQERTFDYLNRNVEISVLDIPPDVDENLVFETLNARGKRLDDVDLVRNHLYSYFPESAEPERRQALQESLERPKSLLSPKKLPQFLRAFLQCRYGFLQETRLYRKARARIETEANGSDPQTYVFSLASDLGRRENIDLFQKISLLRLSDTLTGNLPQIRGKRTLDVLLGELTAYTVSHPLCFALLHRFFNASNAERKAIKRAVTHGLRNLNSFIMRSVFVNRSLQPTKIDQPLADAANQVFAGIDRSSLNIMGRLRDCDAFDVIEDSSFTRRVAETEFRSTRGGRGNQKALRLLFAINAQEQAGSDALNLSGCSVEHVLPESSIHWPYWPSFKNADYSACVYRLGNMVVLSRRENRGGDRFNRSYDVKREAFGRSPIHMAGEVARKHREWSPAVIEQRSNQLASSAARIWKFWT